MGITRNQLKKLGFKADNKSDSLYYKFPDKERELMLFKSSPIMHLREPGSEFIPIVNIDDTGFFETQRVLQDINIGLNPSFTYGLR